MVLNRSIRWLIIALGFTLSAFLFVLFFNQLPAENTVLALDWGGIWDALRRGIHYDIVNGLRNPPWSVLPLLPLGWLPMKIAWGLLAFLTTLVLVVSVPRIPRRGRYWLSMLLLVGHFLAMRNMADGNLEGIVIAGVLLIVYGYHRQHPWLLAGGILLATAKPQESSLLLLALGVYVLLTFPRQTILRLVGGLLIVIVPMMLWRGQQWLAALFGTYQAGTIMDVGLMAALRRAALFPDALNWLLWLLVIGVTAGVVWLSQRTLSREKAGMLIAASLLIAPYAAGNNVLAVIAIGIIPLFQRRWLLGGALIMWANAAILINQPRFLGINAYWWTIYLLVVWGIFLVEIGQREIRYRMGNHPAPEET